jgi:hypothetical protein
MFIAELLPRDFPDMNLLDQIEAMIDVYGMTMMITGNTEYKDNIEMLEVCREECIRRNSSFNMFELMGPEITKENFRKLKSQSVLMKRK